MNIHPVIIAGGSGTRFWPASRVRCPKQFLRIISPNTMIEQTIERVRSLCPEKNLLIVSSEMHHSLMEDLVRGKNFIILEEPFGRNTAPAIGLAALYLKKSGAGDDPMIVLPADHYINDVAQFRNRLVTGCRLAKEDGAIVTVGIVPTRPETGYGYLHRSRTQKEINGTAIYRVGRFVEKPNQENALNYVTSGEYFWNGGIFIFTPSAILEEIKMHLPAIYQGLLRIESSLGKPEFSEILRSVYRDLPSVSIDYGVMEKTERPILAVPGDFGWSDVGSWNSVHQLREKEWDVAGNLVHGKGILMDTRSALLFNQSNQTLVTLGLKDIIIVSTDEVTLVADARRSQDMRMVIEELKKRGLEELL
jgi:mannose-1-phosphate guanylyltransferase